MSPSLGIVVLCADPAHRTRLERELAEATFVPEAAGPVERDLLVVTEAWPIARELRARGHRGPIVTLCPCPEDSKIAAAIDSGILTAAVIEDYRPGELLLACQQAQRMHQLRQKAARPRPSDRARLALIIESMADGLVMTERGLDEVLINRAAREFLEIPANASVTQQYLKERLGFYPFDLVAAQRRSSLPLREEVAIGDRLLSSIISPVLDAGGQPVGVVVVLRDITDYRSLAKRQEEFVSVVSHELRSPLTSITGALDIALSDYAGRLNDKQKRYLTMARESASSLNQIVDDLLDVARSEQGDMPIHLTAVSLEALTREAVSKYERAASAKQIDLRVKCETGLVSIAGDPDRLTQVLNNLLSNAVKFTPPLGRIDIEIFGPSVASSHVGVSVYNNGEPIPDAARERIFEKFEQLKDSTTRRVGGSGLGLAISRAIIEAHGGRIWVESGREGAKFVFTLPCAPADEVVPAEIADESSAPAPPSGEIVVLVDSNRYSSYILKGILMTAGHQVIVATDADDALGAVRTNKPALTVVVAADGEASDRLALVEILGHDPDTRKSTVLVLAGADAREDALQAGAAEVCRLPIDPAPFRKTCARLITEAANAHAKRVLVVDDDTAIRSICAEVLKQAGLTVRQAANGLAAISEAKRFRPDLLLLDIMMPDLDGFQTAEHLRADANTAMTPIIFLSARGETADKVRAFRIGAEDYVVKPFVAAELVARVRKALERRALELGASPTTQLPGAGAIESEIERRLGDTSAAFCYLDLDNLKAFNDHYGYAKADGIIRQTGDLIRDVIRREGNEGDFIGHIAGDDFVFITTLDRVDRVCSSICKGFDRIVPLYYNKSDRERGYIEAKDRYGDMRRFPLMSVSLATITGHGSRLHSYSALASAAAGAKKQAKSLPGSSYVRDGQAILAGEQSHLNGSEVA